MSLDSGQCNKTIFLRNRSWHLFRRTPHQQVFQSIQKSTPATVVPEFSPRTTRTRQRIPVEYPINPVSSRHSRQTRFSVLSTLNRHGTTPQVLLCETSSNILFFAELPEKAVGWMRTETTTNEKQVRHLCSRVEMPQSWVMTISPYRFVSFLFFFFITTPKSAPRMALLVASVQETIRITWNNTLS